MALRPPAILISSSSSFVPAPRRSSGSLSSSFFPPPPPPKPFRCLRLSSSLTISAKKRKDAGVSKLELDIYDFMEKSENPSEFPTREELIAGGRPDLAEEILKEGGWLSYGWMEPGEEKEAVEISGGFLEEDSSSSSSGGPM